MRSCNDDGFSGGGGGATAGAGVAGFDGSVAAAVLAFPFPFSSSFPTFSFSAEAGPRLAGAGARAAGALLLRGRSGSLLGLGVVAIRGLALTRQQAGQALLALASWNEAADTGQWSHYSQAGDLFSFFGGDLEGGFKFETGESDSLLALCWKRSPPREPGSAGYLLGLFRGFFAPC